MGAVNWNEIRVGGHYFVTVWGQQQPVEVVEELPKPDRGKLRRFRCILDRAHPEGVKLADHYTENMLFPRGCGALCKCQHWKYAKALELAGLQMSQDADIEALLAACKKAYPERAPWARK